jgi:predicted phage tail protein
MSRLISGSLGGSQPSKPTEEEDAGFSTSVGTVLDILSEGPIEGLIGDMAQAIYVDNTPVENPNGKRNFKGITIRHRRGLANQSVLPDLDELTQETPVNLEVKKDSSVTRTIINNQLDAIRIRFAVQLQENKTDGGIEGSDMDFRVMVRQGNGAFVQRKRKQIKARYSGLTEFEIQFGVDNKKGSVDSFQVRIEKLSDDSSDTKSRILRWQSYSEIIRAKVTYDHTALVNMDFEAEQFNAVPVRSYRVGGIRVRIPSNAVIRDDRSLAFSGQWDGTFITTQKAMNDPVWHLYEILTNKRWGLGVYLDEKLIDKWSLYNCSVYNNERIPDGFGGFEPRFSCSTILQTKEKAYDVINALCSCCNMKPFWAEGVVQFWQDRPGPVVYQFTKADVENGQFSYSRSALRTRFTTVYVTWNDPDDFYNQAIETVDDVQGTSKYGVRETEIVAYGCFNRGQAIRAGRHYTFTSLNDTETVSFVSKGNGAFCRPGDIIQVLDPFRANIEYGGLIKNSGYSAPNANWFIQVDKPVYMPTGGNITYTSVSNTLISLPIISSPGAITDYIFVGAPITNAPVEGSNWIIQAPTITAPQYRIISVEPDSENVTRVNITAAQYTPGKHDFIEKNIEIYRPPTRLLNPPSTVQQPLNANISVGTFISEDLPFSKLTATWERPKDIYGLPDAFVKAFYVEYRFGLNGFWSETATTTNEFFEWYNVPYGIYTIRVASIDTNNKTSLWTTSITLYPLRSNLNFKFNNVRNALLV